MKTLLLATVREYFRLRAGFFLVALFLLFGFLTSREHYAFAVFFLTDDWGMLTLLLLWGAYTLLCAQFVARQFIQPDYIFLHAMRLWPFPQRAFRLAVMAAGFLQPLAYYGVYVLFVASKEKVLPQTWPMAVMWLGLAMGLAGVAEWRLRYPDVASSSRKSGVRLPFRRPVSLVFWIGEWLLRERGLTLLLSKAGAILFVLATLVYDRTGDYDLRLPAIGFLLAYLMNVGVSNELYYWERHVWLWGRSLPVSATRQFLTLLLLHTLLILPETLVALRDGGTLLTAWQWAQLYALGVSSLMLHHARLYLPDTQPEDTGQSLFVAFVGLTFLILYSLPVWAISIALLGGAAWLWLKNR